MVENSFLKQVLNAPEISPFIRVQILRAVERCGSGSRNMCFMPLRKLWPSKAPQIFARSLWNRNVPSWWITVSFEDLTPNLPPKEYREQPINRGSRLITQLPEVAVMIDEFLVGDTIITILRYFFFGASGVNRLGWWRHFSRKWPSEVGSAWVTIHIERFMGFVRGRSYSIEVPYGNKPFEDTWLPELA